MAEYVKATAVAVGDIILDRDATGDDHPFVVVSVGEHHLHLHNCTSFPNSSLKLIKVVKGDKTGDGTWSGKDSYVVKGEDRVVELAKHVVTGQQPGLVPVPKTEPRMFMGQNGPFIMHIPVGGFVSVPMMVPVYSEATYRKVGTIKKARMDEIVTEIGH